MSHFLILRPMRFPGGWGRHRTVNMYMYNNSMVMTNTRFDMDAVRPLRAIISHPEMSEVTKKVTISHRQCSLLRWRVI